MIPTKDTWPGKKTPGKSDIERMYRIAYTVDPSIYRMQDVIDFGLDLHRLKEFGDVVMKRDLSRLRKGAKELWGRMDNHQRAAFLMGNVIEGLRGVSGVLLDLEKLMGPMPDAHEGLAMAQNGLFATIPKTLRDRLDKGFGKWRTNGKT